MEARSNNVKLKDRILWFDGDSTMSEARLIQLVAGRGNSDGLFVSELTETIRQYNQYVPKEKQITIKGSVFELNLEWKIPPEFLKINVRDYVLDKLWDELEDCGWIGDNGDNVSEAGAKRTIRTKRELDLYEQYGLIDVIRTLIYIINTLQTHKVVWGVGRGSSVASYVLYLIGVHDVDSVEYELDITDFLRPE